MKKILIIIIFSFRAYNILAQEEPLIKEIEDSLPAREKVTAAFKSTRVINAHSIEMLRKGNLDFRILHRFGFVDDGIKEFFGLDEASMRMSFDYGISDNFTLGIGRSTFRKEIDVFAKARLMHQSTGFKSVPLSLVLAAGAMVWTEESFAIDKPDFSERSSFYLQLLAGRKFSSKFSIQLSPIWLHSKLPVSGSEQNLIALGGGGRFKFNKSMALVIDYHHVVTDIPVENHHPLSVGVDIETGGHIFQLHFSNSTGMNERAFLNETYGEFFKGKIRFGFNLSRIFQVGKR